MVGRSEDIVPDRRCPGAPPSREPRLPSARKRYLEPGDGLAQCARFLAERPADEWLRLRVVTERRHGDGDDTRMLWDPLAELAPGVETRARYVGGGGGCGPRGGRGNRSRQWR